MSEHTAISPLNETATLRNQLRQLGGMVLELAKHVDGLVDHANAQTMAVTGVEFDPKAAISDLRERVQDIYNIIGE